MLKKINPLIIIIVASFVLRIIYLYTFSKDLFFNTFSDAATYYLWAEKIIAGTSPNPPFFMSPLYPYLVSLIYAILGKSITTILFIQVILDTGTTYLTFVVANLIFNRRTGLIASALYAIFPQAIFYSGLFLMPTLLTFLFTCAAYLVVSALKKGKEGLFIFSGLLFGIASLGRGNILLPAIVPLFYSFRKKYLLGLLTPVICLFVLNIAVGKSPVITTYNFGLNLFIGNNPDASGEYKRPGGLDLINDHDGSKILSHILNKRIRRWETSGFWTNKALSFIKENPPRFLFLTLKKVYLFWGPIDVVQFENIYYVFQRTLLKYLPIRFWLIAPLFLLSIFTLKRKYARFIAIQIILYSVAFLPFFIIGRFRPPIIPSVMILASGFIYYFINRIKKGRYKILIPAISIIAIYSGLFLANQPKIESKILETKSDYALWLAYSNHPKEAYDTTRAILLDHPDNVQALVNMGNFYYRSKNYPIAQILYEKARSIEPNDGEANANLGVTLIALSKPDSALIYLTRAKTLMPYSLSIDSSIIAAKEMLKKSRLRD